MEGMHNLAKRDLLGLLGFMDACLSAQCPNQLVSALDKLEHVVPFERATVCEVSTTPQNPAFFSGIFNHSYDNSWVETYVAQRYQDVDPVVTAVLSTDLPVSWGSAMRSTWDVNRRQRAFLDHSIKFGLVNGITSLTRADSRQRRTLLSMSLPAEVMPEPYTGIVRTATAHLHGALLRFVRPAETAVPVSGSVGLTRRESEVLKWASIGKTCWEIGKILRISERTVKFHLGNTFAKLDVVNRSQAIAKALGLGLLTL
jgi:LuxR family transcriptional regulator, quorum-sensing system regulator CviR